jgi:delta-aminolevulinic acid dehydratase/porphobilinogen synthase
MINPLTIEEINELEVGTIIYFLEHKESEIKEACVHDSRYLIIDENPISPIPGVFFINKDDAVKKAMQNIENGISFFIKKSSNAISKAQEALNELKILHKAHQDIKKNYDISVS